MVLERGEKVHVMVRRRFETDLRRHLVGVVVEATDWLVRVEGWVYVLDTATNLYLRRPDKRTRIVGLCGSDDIINILPPDADLEQTKYIVSPDKRLVVTDGKSFTLDVNEFGATK
jgi:hypothetical protein